MWWVYVVGGVECVWGGGRCGVCVCGEECVGGRCVLCVWGGGTNVCSVCVCGGCFLI